MFTNSNMRCDCAEGKMWQINLKLITIMKIEMIKSPLNYTGGKYKLLPQILPYFPSNINTFVDMFCGGLNVSANVKCKKIIANDLGQLPTNEFAGLS